MREMMLPSWEQEAWIDGRIGVMPCQGVEGEEGEVRQNGMEESKMPWVVEEGVGLVGLEEGNLEVEEGAEDHTLMVVEEDPDEDDDYHSLYHFHMRVFPHVYQSWV